jgi:DNA-binding MarR family transcriptional regulator
MTTREGNALTPEDCGEALRVCGSFNLRRASRLVTQLYDDYLQPVGLRSTQVVVLLAVAKESEISMVRLAREMVLSPSTLSRNLRPLERDGLIKIMENLKRGKRVKLTAKGRQTLLAAVPCWQQAQQKFTELIGSNAWQELSERLTQTVTALRA